MLQFADTHTLNTRTFELLKYELVEHHLEREKTRKEWYEITERGNGIWYLWAAIAEVTEKKKGSLLK